MSYVIVLLLIGYIVYLIIGKIRKPKASSVKPNEIDVNKPVENPELVAAIEDYKTNPSDEKLPQLYSLINNAIYLALVDMSQVDSEKISENEMVVKKNSVVAFPALTTKDGGNYQPLFTDWKHIYDFTKDKPETMILPAYDAWSFFFRKDNALKGVVINPASDDIILSAEQIETFLYDLKKNRCATDIVDLLNYEFASNTGEVNPELIALAAGNIIGLFMFLSFDFNLSKVEPGTVYLSEQTNILGSKMFYNVIKKLEERGVPADQLVPDENVNYDSNLTYIEVIENIQKPLIDLMNKYELDYESFIDICGDVAAFVVLRVSQKLPINKGLGIVFWGIVQGSKTVPMR